MQDDMVKEAIQEKVTANKIRFEFGQTSYYEPEVKFEGGVLVIFQKPENFWSNVGDLGQNIEKIL